MTNRAPRRRSYGKGKKNERRVLETCNVLIQEKALPWLKDEARKATESEDYVGINVVVPSDVGDLYLQVKSTEQAALKFLQLREEQEHYRHKIITVVIAVRDDGQLRNKLLMALYEARTKTIENQSRM